MSKRVTADAGLVPIVLSTLRKAGWKAARIQAGTAHGGRMKLAEAGWPDIVGLSPSGRSWYIECKAPAGKLRPAQAEFLRWCQAHGFHYVVVRSTEDVAYLVALVGAKEEATDGRDV